MVPDAPPDAAPFPCGYTERVDRDNEAAAEPTGLALGAAPVVICGTIHAGQFDAASSTIDADGYRVTVPSAASLIVRFAVTAGAAAASKLSVYVFTTDDNPALLFGASTAAAVDDHGAFLIALPAGRYDVVARAEGAGPLAAGFDYKLQIAPDGAARCPAVTAAPGYREAADGAGAGNDVVEVDFDVDPAFQLTASAADAPEPTGLTIEGATAVRIAGSSANQDASDDFLDRDTYLVRTGPGTGELTLRLGWASADASLDYYVFPADGTDQVGSSVRFEGNTATERYNVVPVKPGTAYWIWIAAHDGSQGLPIAYDLSICGGAAPR